jgi:hypothetical protein
MQSALTLQRNHPNYEDYIKFISRFGPALTGMAFWNNNKATKMVSELLTISDEAFIHLCIINYSATWKAQEKSKFGETEEKIPVSRSMFSFLMKNKQKFDNNIVVASFLGSPRPPTRRQTDWLAVHTLSNFCHVDGLKMASKRSTR